MSEPIGKNKDLAANLIRHKLNDLYSIEPNAEAEEKEIQNIAHRSKHQQVMYELANSGKDHVTIQTEWHKYYAGLSNQGKREVWAEFYASNQNTKQNTVITNYINNPKADPKILVNHINQRGLSKFSKPRKLNSQKLRDKLIKNATSPTKITWRHHLKSLLFGLAMGSIVLIILLFGFFNQVILTPFIQPNRNPVATPIILSTASINASSTPEVIIPKINVEIPVNYNVPTDSENLIENALQGGVVHFPSTVNPGQIGNAAFFGHSANNIFNPGQYKFAFVLLHQLVPGDIFYLTFNSKVYIYKVFKKEIVSPNDVNVLNSVSGHSATATLITCDPPGTSLNRLIVIGDQISPNINGDTTPSATSTNLASSNQLTSLPSNGASLWSRFISTTFGKLSTALFIGIVIWNLFRWYNKEFLKKADD